METRQFKTETIDRLTQLENKMTEKQLQETIYKIFTKEIIKMDEKCIVEVKNRHNYFLLCYGPLLL